MVAGFVYERRIGGNAAENRAVLRVVGSRVGDSDKGLGIVVGTAIPHIGQVGSVCLSGALHSGRVEQERWLRQHGGGVETSRATRLKSNAKCRSTECDEVILSNQPQPARLKVRSANMAELKRSRLAEHLKSITSAPCQMFRLAALFVANELDADMLVGTGSPRTARAMAASSRPTISSSSASVTTVGGQIRA